MESDEYVMECDDDAMKGARERQRRDEGKKGDMKERRCERTSETARGEDHKGKIEKES